MSFRTLTATEKFGVALGAIILFPALYSLVASVVEANASGKISVIYRRGTHAPVPWIQGWAYFAGVLLLVGAGASFLAAALLDALFVLLAIVLLGAGGFLFLFSGVLSSVGGATFLFGYMAVVVCTFVVNKHFGKLPAAAFWGTSVAAFFVYAYART